MIRLVNATDFTTFYAAAMDGVQDNALGIAQVLGFVGPRPYLRAIGDTNLYVGPVHALALGVAATVAGSVLTAGTLVVLSTAVETDLVLSGLTLNTWYVVYAYNNAGAVGFEIDDYPTSPPDTALRYKAGDPSRVYVGTVYSTGTNSVRPVRTTGDRYVWRESAASLTPPLSNGHATAYSTLSLAAWAPPHARVVRFRAAFDALSGGSDQALLRTNGDSISQHAINGYTPVGQTNTNYDELEMETDASQNIQYAVGNASSSLTIRMRGFSDPFGL